MSSTVDGRVELFVEARGLARAIKSCLTACPRWNDGSAGGEFLERGYRVGNVRAVLALNDQLVSVVAEGRDTLAVSWAATKAPSGGLETCWLAVDLKTLRAVLDKLGSGVAVLAHEGDWLFVAAGGFEAKLSATRIDAPKLPVAVKLQSLPDALCGALRTLEPCVSRDDTRPSIMHVALEHDEQFWAAIATDANKLGLVTCAASKKVAKAFRNVLIPRHVVMRIGDLLAGSIKLVETDAKGWIGIESDLGAMYWRRKVDQFPPWRKVLDGWPESTAVIKLAIAPTLSELAKVMAVEDDAKRVRLAAGDTGSVYLSTEHPAGKAEAFVPLGSWTTGEQREIHLDGDHFGKLLRMHAQFGAKSVSLTLHGPHGQVGIEPAGPPAQPLRVARSVVMPMSK